MTESFWNRPSKAPWWDDECITLINTRREATKTLLKNPTLENLSKLIKTENTVKKNIKKIKTKKFTEFVEDKISPSTSDKEIWNTV